MGMTASQFNALKNACNAEWRRRCYNGSMAGYSQEPPVAVNTGGIMLANQGNIIMTPFTRMNVHGNLATSSAGTLIQSNFDYNTINSWLNTLRSRGIYDSANDCNSACSGLCVSCQGSCTSCSGCSGGCSGCSGCGGCDGGCWGCGGCDGGCWGCGGCDGGCSGCGGACTNDCWGCSGCGPCTGCEGGPGCNSGCVVNCAGCSGCRGYPSA